MELTRKQNREGEHDAAITPGWCNGVCCTTLEITLKLWLNKYGTFISLFLQPWTLQENKTEKVSMMQYVLYYIENTLELWLSKYGSFRAQILPKSWACCKYISVRQQGCPVTLRKHLKLHRFICSTPRTCVWWQFNCPAWKVVQKINLVTKQAGK